MQPRIARCILGSVLVLALGASAETQQAPGRSQAGQDTPSAGMSERCKAMMASRQKMMGEMKATDQRLDQLVTKMNAASGEAKVDAIATVVTELVEARTTMRDRMMSMQEGMMGHMSEHMEAGPQSMAMCPMMKRGGMR